MKQTLTLLVFALFFAQNLGAQSNPVSICMKPNEVRLIPDASFKPDFYATNTDGTETLISSGLSFLSSNPNVVTIGADGVFSAPGALGEANIAASWNGLQLQTQVKVVSDFQSTPADRRVIKVAAVVFDPPIPEVGGKRFSEHFWPYNGGPRALMQIVRDSIFSASHGTIDMQIVEIHDEPDVSLNKYDGNTISVDSLYQLLSEPGWATIADISSRNGLVFDYNGMLDKYDLCEKSNAKQIDEIWIFGLPSFPLAESNMTGTGAFWINGPVIEGNACTDLIAIMGFGSEREAGCLIHAFNHRVETTMAKVYNTYYRYTPDEPPYPAGLVKDPWQLYMNFDNLAGESGNAHIGNGHFPPNAVYNYGYDNYAFVKTYEPNWKRYPLLFDETVEVNCETWGCETGCGGKFSTWWLKHLPHYKCKDKYGRLNNWWTYIFDYNEGLAMEAQIDDCNCKMFTDGAVANCASKADYPWHEWLASVKIGTTSFTSGKSQYTDFTQKVFELIVGTTPSIEIGIGFSYYTADEYVRIWIDKNKDGAYEDAEKAWEGKLNKPADGQQTATLSGFGGLNTLQMLAGDYKMRISLKRGGYPTPCETIPFGEVEDYTIRVLDSGTNTDLASTAWEIIPANQNCYTNPGQAMTFFGGLAINLGNVAVGPFKAKVYLSKDQAISMDDVLWQTVNYAGLAPGSTASLNITSPVPQNVTPGRYFAIAVVDSDQQINETNESNNRFATMLQIGAPDLVIQNLSGQWSSGGGYSSFSVGFQVQNLAGFPMSELTGNVVVKAYLSTDNVLNTSSDIEVGEGSVHITQFDANGLVAGSLVVSVPSLPPLGSYYLIYKVISPSCESNYQNNVSAAYPFELTPAWCTITAQANNVSCSGSQITFTLLLESVNGGPLGWVSNYNACQGCATQTISGQYGVPKTFTLAKGQNTTVQLTIFDLAGTICNPTSVTLQCPAPCSMDAAISNVTCSGINSTATATILVSAVNGGAQGWIGSYPTPGGPSFFSGQYGVPATVSVYLPPGATSVPLNFFDPTNSGCITTGVLTCPSSQYCTSAGSFPWEDWISGVKIGATEKTSGKSQYSDFTSTVFNLTKNTATDIILTTSYSYFTWDEYWRVWIDYNHDGVFNPTTELAFNAILPKPPAGANVSSPLYGSIVIPAYALDGNTRMRVSMRRGAYAAPCGSFDFGEVEDYTVHISSSSTGPLPDLTLTQLNHPPTVQQGSILLSQFNLNNTGTGAAIGVFDVKSWLSTDQVLDAGDYQNGFAQFSNLAAGTTLSQINYALNIQQNLAPGPYYLILTVDPDNRIAESNEGNNTLVSANTIMVQPSGSAGADIELMLAADKTSVPIYANVTYTYTVKNTGNQPITKAVIFTGICGNTNGAGFGQATQLVYAGVPDNPTLGAYNFVDQRWTITNLAPGQVGVLKITFFTLTTAERKVIAFVESQTPGDTDSQPGTTPANCQPTQDDEAVWTINAGQTFRLSSSIGSGDPDSIQPFLNTEPTLFPNPTGDFVHIFFPADFAGKSIRLQMFNPLGVAVLNMEFPEMTEAIQTLDLSGLINGQYMMRIETPERRAVVKKLIVSRMY